MNLVKKLLWIFIGILLISFIVTPVLAPEESKNNIAYTPSSTTWIKEDGKENVALWLGVRNAYENNQYKPRELVKSFKEDPNIICNVIFDGYNIAECSDYNETSRTIDLSITESRWDMFWESPLGTSFETPLKKYHLEYNLSTKESKKVYDKEFEKVVGFEWYNLKKEYIIKTNPNEIIEFGEHSTIIILQDNVTENMGDTMTESASPNTNSGTSTTLSFGKLGAEYRDTYLKFNITAIPSGATIVNATVNLWIVAVGGAGTNELHRCDINRTATGYEGWEELTMTWNKKNDIQCGGALLSTAIPGGNSKWMILEATSWVQNRTNESLWNVSFMVNYTTGADVMPNADSREDTVSAQRPYLNVTYDPPPNTAPIVNNQFPLNQTSQYIDSANFTYNVTDPEADGIGNCTLYINGVVIETDTSITQTVNQTINRTSLSAGQHLWKIGCWDEHHLQGNSSEYNLTIIVDSPNVDLNFPPDDTQSYSPYANFTYNVSTISHSITSCDLIINDVLNETDTSITEIINQTFNLTTLDYGDSIWIVQCESSEGYKANSSEYNYSRERAYPNVDLNFPTDDFNTSIRYINFTYNVSINYGSINECSLWLDGVLNETDNTITQIINQTFNKSLADNSYYWLIECESDLGQKANSSTYNLTIDLTAPIINESVGLIDIVTISLPTSSYWYFNVSDEGVNIGDCWYYTSDSSTNTSVTCNANITTNWASEGVKYARYCANDTLGNEDCRTNYLEVYYYNWTQSASKDTLGEGGSATFRLVINMTDLESRFGNTYAYLNHNNTQYTPSSVHNAENYTFSYTLAIPLGTGSPTGNSINWNWSYAIMNSTDILINTTTSDQTQTIYSMGVGNCSFYNHTILNYTLRSEENKTILNGTIETDFIIRSFTDNVIRFNYSILNEDVSSIEVCVANETLNHEDYRLYVTTRYEADGHVIEYHYIDNYNLSSSSSVQYIDLYDLDSADSTSFLINYKDEFYLSVEGAIIDIQRFYVGDGIYRSVEMGKTNDAGQTRAHLVTEDVKYMFYVRVDGTLVYVSPEYLALCLTAPCHIDLYEVTDTSSEYEEAGNIDYNFDLDEDTRSITFTFSTQDGTPSDIDMNVTRMDAYSNHTACEETQTSSGGSLTCTVPTAYTNTTYIVEIYEDNEFITQRFFNLNPPAEDYFGYTGIFLAFIVIITLVFMAITSGIAMVVFTILGLIIVGAINIINVGNILGVGSAIVWLTVAGVIIIYKLSQRRYH